MHRNRNQRIAFEPNELLYDVTFFLNQLARASNLPNCFADLVLASRKEEKQERLEAVGVVADQFHLGFVSDALAEALTTVTADIFRHRAPPPGTRLPRDYERSSSYRVSAVFFELSQVRQRGSGVKGLVLVSDLDSENLSKPGSVVKSNIHPLVLENGRSGNRFVSDQVLRIFPEFIG